MTIHGVGRCIHTKMTHLRACLVLASLVACADEFSTPHGDASIPIDSAVTNEGGAEAAVVDAAGCAIDCQGGACLNGVCQPTVLARGLNGPYGIAIFGDKVYVTEYVPHGGVLQLSKNGVNQTPQVLATEAALAKIVKFPGDLSQPFFIAASASC